MRRILVVDDHPDPRYTLHRILVHAGFESFECSSAEQALERINEIRPDLALIDLLMPGMDGIEMFHELRNRPQTRDLPVVFMTGSITEGLCEAISLGANAGKVLFKLDVETFIPRIESELAQRAASPARNHTLSTGRFSFDVISRTASFDGTELPRLPGKRFDLLMTLALHDGPVTHEELLAEVWNAEADPKVVAVTIQRLRHDLASRPHLRIETSSRSYRLIITNPAHHDPFPLRPK